MITNLLKKVFFSKRLDENFYRAILINTSEKCGTDGCLNITFDYILCCKETNRYYRFKETITDNINIGRSAEFFWFLETNHIKFDNYFDLVGLVFDAALQYDFVGGTEVPVLVEKDLVAPPPKY